MISLSQYLFWLILISLRWKKCLTYDKKTITIIYSNFFPLFPPPQDEEIDVLEPNDMAKRERSGFKTFKQTKRGENSCSACSSHENSNPVEQNICQRKMFFVFLWVWKKEKILSSHKESIFRPRALMLHHWATETLRWAKPITKFIHDTRPTYC